MISRISKSFKKNLPEITALLTGRMPKFVYGIKYFNDIPVFCFHSAQYPLFEKQLQYLCENGYKTLTADELYERRLDKDYKNNGKEIVITFDDGMASVWTVAYPLLKKYEHKIISFILPGLMVEGDGLGTTIDDVTSEQEKFNLSNRDHSDEPLCNWQEVKIMHESGLIDFQSHGMQHALISTSPKVIDFIHPDYDVYHYGNIHIPVYRDADGNDTRTKVLGHPVYQHAPRLSGKVQYLDPVELRRVCADYVAENGGEILFGQLDWRAKLKNIVVTYQAENTRTQNIFESESRARASIVAELVESKSCIEEKIGKTVNHFCFPWFVASQQSATIAKQSGYKSIHLGELSGYRATKELDLPLEIFRVQEEYLLRLPGKERLGLKHVLKYKINGRI